MAGKGIVFILTLFVVIQSMHARVSLDYNCPSIFSLKVGIQKHQCTTNENCHRARYVCCENLEKVKVCVEGTSVRPAHNPDKTARSLSESTNKSDEVAAVEPESSNNSDEATRDVSKSTDNSDEAARVVPDSTDNSDEAARDVSKSTNDFDEEAPEQ